MSWVLVVAGILLASAGLAFVTEDKLPNAARAGLGFFFCAVGLILITANLPAVT